MTEERIEWAVARKVRATGNLEFVTFADTKDAAFSKAVALFEFYSKGVVASEFVVVRREVTITDWQEV
jgi:hypothetical protein